MNTQLQQQITKHNNIITTKEKAIQQAEFGMTIAKLTGNPSLFINRYEARMGECKHHIKHSELMIRLFNTFNTAPINKGKLKIIYNLIKANAVEIDHYMSLCVEENLYTEYEYKNHVERFMEEIRRWERLGC